VPFLLTDTVGFIRKLPTTLIESFKSTLDEVREADILLHVIDISHHNYEEHIDVVNTTLAEIGAADKPQILVFNKIDLYEEKILSQEAKELADEEFDFTGLSSDKAPQSKDERLASVLEFLKNSYLDTPKPKAIFISAEHKENLGELRETLLSLVKNKHVQIFPNWVKY
jgi:GTP-binding protein HflX